MIKRIALVLALVCLASTAGFTSSNRFQSRAADENPQRRSAAERSVERESDEDCQRLYDHTNFDQAVKLVAEEKRTLSRSSINGIDVEGSVNGGVSIKGWDQQEILVKACKLAGAQTKEEAQGLLDQISISTEGGKIFSRGPEDSMTGRRAWVVQFLIYVPRDLAVEASVHNGGLSLTDLTGRVNAKSRNGGIAIRNSGGMENLIELFAQNGGIALSNVAGRINARTANGGISLSGGRGDVKLESQNGGIVIRLPERDWSGESLQAHSNNGGLVLKVPQGFGSGIEAETSTHATLDCRLPECRQGQRDEEENRKHVRIGGAAAVVRVSTQNGMLQILPEH
ncbi:MAG TPA: hypothetical protein VF747_05710 [Blastocatellia bacterium]